MIDDEPLGIIQPAIHLLSVWLAVCMGLLNGFFFWDLSAFVLQAIEKQLCQAFHSVACWLFNAQSISWWWRWKWCLLNGETWGWKWKELIQNQSSRSPHLIKLTHTHDWDARDGVWSHLINPKASQPMRGLGNQMCVWLVWLVACENGLGGAEEWQLFWDQARKGVHYRLMMMMIEKFLVCHYHYYKFKWNRKRERERKWVIESRINPPWGPRQYSPSHYHLIGVLEAPSRPHQSHTHSFVDLASCTTKDWANNNGSQDGDWSFGPVLDNNQSEGMGYTGEACVWIQSVCKFGHDPFDPERRWELIIDIVFR